MRQLAICAVETSAIALVVPDRLAAAEAETARLGVNLMWTFALGREFQARPPNGEMYVTMPVSPLDLNCRRVIASGQFAFCTQRGMMSGRKRQL